MNYLDETPASAPVRKKRKRGNLYKIKKWYRTRTRAMKMGIWCSLALSYLFLCSCVMSAVGTLEIAPLPTPVAMNMAATMRKMPPVTPTLPVIPAKKAASPSRAGPTPTQPSAPKLSVTFTCAQAVNFASGAVCVHTLPAAALTITVRYCSGNNASSGSLQGTSHADAQGNFTWRWVPQARCRGEALATVTAKWYGQRVAKARYFVVR